MTRATFIVSTKGKVCARYYTESLRFDNVFAGILFLLFNNLLDALIYFRSYKLAEQIGTDPDSRIWWLNVRRNWLRQDAEKTGIICNKVLSEKVFGLEEQFL